LRTILGTDGADDTSSKTATLYLSFTSEADVGDFPILDPEIFRIWGLGDFPHFYPPSVVHVIVTSVSRRFVTVRALNVKRNSKENNRRWD
jgi:hypothetical protein